MKPGTLVLLRNSAMDGRKGDKLRMRYHGQFEIFKDLGKGVFKLRNSTTGILLKKTQNSSRLKLYRKKNCKQSPPPSSGSQCAMRSEKRYRLIDSDSESSSKKSGGSRYIGSQSESESDGRENMSGNDSINSPILPLTQDINQLGANQGTKVSRGINFAHIALNIEHNKVFKRVS